MKHILYRLKYRYAPLLNLKVPVDVSLELSSFCTNACGYCYHGDPKTLPFKRGHMSRELAFKILDECAEIGVNSFKTNYRGESTMNPCFEDITAHAKRLARGSTLMDRITNTNMNFKIDREDIFRGLCNQTKVKVSFDSFIPSIFEKQRRGSKFDLTIANINKLYNYSKRDNEIVIQAVRTEINKDEDLAHEIKSRWPHAHVSIRDCVDGRSGKYSAFKKRDESERQSCIQAHARLMIRHDGEVGACCPDIGGKIILGNANSDHIFDIFNSKQSKNLKLSLKYKSAFMAEPCKSCSSFETFKGYKHPWNS